VALIHAAYMHEDIGQFQPAPRIKSDQLMSKNVHVPCFLWVENQNLIH